MTESDNRRKLPWLERRNLAQLERKEKLERKSDKKEKRRSFVIEKINALKEKFYAVAAKRKWLVFMIVAAIAAYLIIFKGGFSFGGGILDKIKGFFV